MAAAVRLRLPRFGRAISEQRPGDRPLSPTPAILNASYALAHAPDLVRYGSKPVREIGRDPSLLARINGSLRPWDEVVAYPPNQVFIGNLAPEDLASIPRP